MEVATASASIFGLRTRMLATPPRTSPRTVNCNRNLSTSFISPFANGSVSSDFSGLRLRPDCLNPDSFCKSKPRSPVITMVIPFTSGTAWEQPPPDLASYLYKNRIVYLGMSFVPSVTELILAEFLYLQYEDVEKPIYLYINSTGTTKGGEKLGYETEAFAIYDVMGLELEFNFLRNLNEGETQEASALLTLLENVSANVMIEYKRIRKLSPSRIFSCKSFLDKLIDDQVPLNFQPAHMIWKAKVPSKVQIFAWSLALGKLNTFDVIQRQNPNVSLSPSWCIKSKINGGSMDHLFLHCHTAVQLWHRLFQAAQISWVMPASSISMLSEFIHAFGKGEKARVLYVKPPIFTLCVGNAWGEAALLLGAGAKGNRAALPSSTIMIKQPIGRIEGQATDVEIARKEIKNVKAELVKLYAKHFGKTPEQIEADIRRPKYFSPSEAVEYGIIDKVLYTEKSPEDHGVVSDLKKAQLI
ncbi:ATP-dependent clp protease proteolytic subunit-related protein 4 [Citrus sinensis]|uniref:ATP-dependent clp protease proteolytic subunit-related protein 4 n=1 Tax=Citrus sinensis TaxID=2711 RepID=A0ACB8LU94_CITSI|nr:ATP-dependent clp protease proteolytic subunit-related protein 4 [Citrus sinensis]